MQARGMWLAVAMVGAGSITLLGQQQPWDSGRIHGVQAHDDPNREAYVRANCKNPEPALVKARMVLPAAMLRNPRPAGQYVEYNVQAIPGVIAAGARWRSLFTDSGNNADSPVGVSDGVFIGQSDKSQILKIGMDGKVELVATDTYAGGAIAMSKDGRLFVGERSLKRSIWEVKPRRLFADKLASGEPLECTSDESLNDMLFDSKGGIYMTMGGVYYANPQGVVLGKFGTIDSNGLMLSRDEKTFYATGRVAGATPPADLKLPANAPKPGANGGLVAFDVQPDGSLTNERQFAWVGSGGMAIDTEGRMYVPADGGVWVVSEKGGEVLGFIPMPRGVGSVALGGPNGRTLFGTALVSVEVFAIDVLAQNIQGRYK